MCPALVRSGRPPRVLHVSQPVTAGVARWVAHAARDQRDHGWDVAVACPREGWLPRTLRADGVPVRCWPAGRAPNAATAGEVGWLGALVARYRPDVLHLHSSKAGLAGRLAVRGRVPTVFQPHSWSFHAVDGRTAAASRRWERWAARWADRIVCVSVQERDEGLAVGIPPAVMTVLHNGVDLRAWPRRGERERAGARLQLGLDAAAPLAVCPGRLCRQKGQDLLLEAWPAIRAAVPDARLALVGEGPDRARLAAAAERTAGVLLAGEPAAVATWLAAADVVVLPSRWEGLALGALEALACGRSVVATDAAGMLEAVGTGPSAAGAVVPLAPAADLPARLGSAVAVRLADRAGADAEGRLGRGRVERLFRLDDALDRTRELLLAVGARDAAADRQPVGVW